MKINKINAGCGQEYMKGDGWENWDMSHEVKADKYLDLRTDTFPAETGSMDQVYLGSVLEQVLQNEHLLHIMNECHRILKLHGQVSLNVPDSRFTITFQDPHDCRHFIPKTFKYFDHREIYYKRYGKTYGYKPWEIVNIMSTQDHILRVFMVTV